MFYLKIFNIFHIGGLVQDCSNSIANALELLQSCTKPSLWFINTLRLGDAYVSET